MLFVLEMVHGTKFHIISICSSVNAPQKLDAAHGKAILIKRKKNYNFADLSIYFMGGTR